MLSDKILQRVGQVNYNKQGSKMKIIECVDKSRIVVEFEENGYIKNTNYSYFKSGIVANPYDKTVHGIGYLGEGEYITRLNGKATKQYISWKNMLQRCYTKEYQEKEPTYTGCVVCDEWLNFQNFAKWFDENYYQIDDQRMAIDKDVLHKGNKLYAPENCVFVPYDINGLFTKCNKSRGSLPVGVSYNNGRGRKKYLVHCNDEYGIGRTIGSFKTPEEAFNVYKEYKERVIKLVAEQYKNKIPKKLYDAMHNWIIEITD
jgi:hypothetical protein